MGRHVNTRSLWQLVEIRRTADAMMDVKMSFQWLALDSTGFSDKSSWKRIGWIRQSERVQMSVFFVEFMISCGMEASSLIQSYHWSFLCPLFYHRARKSSFCLFLNTAVSFLI